MKERQHKETTSEGKGGQEYGKWFWKFALLLHHSDLPSLRSRANFKTENIVLPSIDAFLSHLAKPALHF